MSSTDTTDTRRSCTSYCGDGGIKTIVTMRDPRDQVVSHMFHVRREVDHPWNERINALSDDDALMLSIEGRDGTTPETFFGGVAFWSTFNTEWSTHCPEAGRVRYEDLKADPIAELTRITRDLGIDASPGLLDAVVKRNRFDRLIVGKKIWRNTRKEGEKDSKSFYRKGIVGDWKNYFGPAHIQRFKELAGDTLVDWGYETDLDWS